jgi:hypothetical protein
MLVAVDSRPWIVPEGWVGVEMLATVDSGEGGSRLHA